MTNISSILAVSSVQTFRTTNFSVDQKIPHVLLTQLTVYLFRTSSKAVLSVCAFYTFLTSESSEATGKTSRKKNKHHGESFIPNTLLTRI